MARHVESHTTPKPDLTGQVQSPGSFGQDGGSGPEGLGRRGVHKAFSLYN